jgi:hypothetical protein
MIYNIIIILIIYFLIKKIINDNNNIKNEEMTNTLDSKILTSECRIPTYDNPFMNFILYNDDKLKACDSKKVKNNIKKEYRKHTYPDANDVWGKNLSERYFYTMPNTGMINDQTGFAKWCYGIKENCKTDGKDCLRYIRDY